jgi:alkylation response protein AidB-like acyl-CoA dehydrogenase
VYCLAFAEPNHGSDLAAVETRGDVLGNQVVVTGRKTWVAGADRAGVALVLCRTAPDELSCVRVPLPGDNVELRPIRTLSGELALFDVLFDGERVPIGNLVGKRGDGLRLARVALQRPRWHDAEQEFRELVQTARDYDRSRDPQVRQQLAWAYAQVRVIGLLAERDPSLADLVWSEYHRRLGEIAMDVLGADGLVRTAAEAYATNRWQQVFLTSRADTLAAGTSELQRNLIAERVLGLPT